ncbi:MAG: 1-acyl-sn-glycerol-3-phosphate acyltransferase [Alphaproteobacteria bacterium]|nr:1-acyl-sn-glycerol-3-phosphate acyltransferase [Alphaproteobacteria bacterium]
MNRITSVARISLGFLLVVVGTIILIPVLVLCLPWRATRVRLCNYWGKIVGRATAWLTLARLEIHHRERLNGSFPAIYITNHTSNLDPLLAMWLCPVGGCGVAKKEVGQIPFFGWMYRLSGHLLVDRGNRENAIAAMNSTAEVVRRYGLGMWLWPEGTRSRDGRLLPFKKGLAHLALATGLPIVPVVIHNAHRNWPKRTFRLYPVTVDVDVLEPIPTADWAAETLDAHLFEVWKRMANQLNDDQKPPPEVYAEAERKANLALGVSTADTMDAT